MGRYNHFRTFFEIKQGGRVVDVCPMNNKYEDLLTKQQRLAIKSIDDDLDRFEQYMTFNISLEEKQSTSRIIKRLERDRNKVLENCVKTLKKYNIREAGL